MGVETALVIKGLSAVSALASVAGGVQQRSEANKQAKLAGQEAEDRARLEARENIELEKRQKLAFLKSGVAIDSGSPLLVMEEDKRRGEENVDAILGTGANRAASLRSSGRSALIGGITKGIGTAAQGFQGGIS